jgi:hypothetical protein
VRGAEIQLRLLKDIAAQHQRDIQAQQERQQRQFEQKFNALVDAVAGFAKAYNEGKGAWPTREAGRLREAMRDLQSMEKSLQRTSRVPKVVPTDSDDQAYP